MEHDEQPRQELVKCVLVGDNAVGKTRLTCARATRQQCSLSQLLNQHVPTVWAIDQYRIYKEVLQNSWTIIDGTNVSLRLWDTFGDHHKDRRFAYGRSDVVLMCFDIGRQASLDNCREMWYHQIKRFCPNTPILLVGCKNDVRFMYQDPRYLKYCRDRSPLVRQVRERDLVMPEKARAVARELGLPYYETSVLTYYGVDELFENAIRAALRARRNQRFWMAGLKKVLQPALQEPFCPPRPKLPSATVKESVYNEDLTTMSQDQHYTDVIFLCGSIGFSAHRFILAASSPLLMKIFKTDFSSQEQPSTRSNSETSLLSLSHAGSNMLYPDFFNIDDTEYLIPGSETSSPLRYRGASTTFTPTTSQGTSPSDDSKSYRYTPKDYYRSWGKQLKLRSSITTGSPVIKLLLERERIEIRRHRATSSNGLNCMQSISASTGSPSSRPFCHAVPQIFTYEPKPGVFRNLNYPALQSIRIEQIQSLDGQGQIISSIQTVLQCTKLIQPQAMNQVIKYIYGSAIDRSLCSVTDLKQAAEFLDIPDLYQLLVHEIGNKQFEEDGIVGDLGNVKSTTQERKRPIQLRGLAEVCLLDSLFSDIIFRLEDGTISAHKPLLMARCDMMRAMFTHNDFKEKSARVVHFPGVSALTFHQLLYYIYTDGTPPKISLTNCVDLIELANRLCLPRLVTLVEAEAIKQALELSNSSPSLSKKGSDGYVQGSNGGFDLTEEALSILEPCQMHNANQLGDWCLSYLSLNYNHICRKYTKILRKLHPENQAALNVNRWPPIWYLRDHDNYLQMAAHREREEQPKAFRKRARRNSGCLCFSSSSSSSAGLGTSIGEVKSRRDSEMYDRPN